MNGAVHTKYRQTKHYRIAGGTIAADWLGASSAKAARTLVFLHQGLGTKKQWRSIAERLSRELSLPAFLYDRFGHGESSAFPTSDEDPPHDYLTEEAQVHLPAVLAAAGIDQPVFIGHSDGATIALMYGCRFPRAIVAAVSIAAHVFNEALTRNGIRQTEQAFRRKGLARALEAHHGEKTEALFRRWHDTWLDESFEDWSMVEHLRQFSAPLLVLQGSEDEYGSKAQVAAIAKNVSGPCTSQFIAKCGHDPIASHGDDIAETILCFLQHQL